MKTDNVLLIQESKVLNKGATILVVDLSTLSPLGKALYKEWQATEHPALVRALGEVCGIPLCEVVPMLKAEKVEAKILVPVVKPSSKRRASVGSNAFQRWSDKSDTALQDLYTKGVSATEIGYVLGRSRQSVTNRIWLLNKNV